MTTNDLKEIFAIAAEERRMTDATLTASVEKLIDAIQSVQDWRGTHVGECIEEVTAITRTAPNDPSSPHCRESERGRHKNL